MLKQKLESRGMTVHLGAQTEAILGEDRVSGIRLKDGTIIDATLVVMAVGIRPNTELAQSCGLRCDRGVLVDDTMQTFDPRVYAGGECVPHRGSSEEHTSELQSLMRISYAVFCLKKKTTLCPT